MRHSCRPSGERKTIVGSEVTWYLTATSRSLREPSVSTLTATKSWALRATQGSA